MESIENRNILEPQAANTTEKFCWICHTSEVDDPNGNWQNPCRCCGTTKWVHYDCVMRYIEVRRHIIMKRVINCPMCKYPIRVVHPPLFRCTAIYQIVMGVLECLLIFLLTMGMLLKLYCTAMLIGALISYQLLGYDNIQSMVVQKSPFFVWIGMPLLPIALLVFQIANGEEHLVSLGAVLPSSVKRKCRYFYVNYVIHFGKQTKTVSIAGLAFYCLLCNGPFKQCVFAILTYMLVRTFYAGYLVMHRPREHVD